VIKVAVTTRRGDTNANKDISKGFGKYPFLDKILGKIKALDLISDELYFIGRDPITGYWVYVGGSDREVRVFDDFLDALAYGLHVSPEEIRSIDVVEVGDYYIKLRICTTEECNDYKTYLE
jgi:hypothetical protein